MTSRLCQLLGFCFRGIITLAYINASVHTRRVVTDRLSVCSTMGEVRGWVVWSDGGGLEGLRVLILTKYDGRRGTAFYELSPLLDTLNIRMVCLWVSVQKKRNLGNRFFHKGRLIAGVVEWTGGGWWGRGRVGLYSNPTYRPLTPNQPTCLEFHYRRGKTDGGCGASE